MTRTASILASVMVAGCCTTDQADGDVLLTFSAGYDSSTASYMVAWSVLDLDAVVYTGHLGVLDSAGGFTDVDRYGGYQGKVRASGNGTNLLSAPGTGGPGVSLALSVIDSNAHVIATDVMLVPPDDMDPFQTQLAATAVPAGFLVLTTRRTSGTQYDLTLTRLAPDGAMLAAPVLVANAMHDRQLSPIPYAIARANAEAWIGYQDGSAIVARPVAADGTLGAVLHVADGAHLVGMAAADDRILVLAQQLADPVSAAIAFIEPTGAVTTVPGSPQLPLEGLPDVIAYPGAGYLVGPSFRRAWLDLDGAVAGGYTTEFECSESSGTVVPTSAGTGLYLVCDSVPDGHDIVTVLDAAPLAFAATPGLGGQMLVEARRTPTDPDDLCPNDN
jgi:hypothetical protein